MRPALCLLTALSLLAALGNPRKEYKDLLLHTPVHENLHSPGSKDRATVLSQNPNDPREPCPTGCVRLGSSDVFVAVTSIGEGNPRIQYTCSSTGHPHSSPTVSSAESHRQQHNHKSLQGITPELHGHHPADPEPSPLHYDGVHKKSYNAKESEQDIGESTVYSDLHLTDMKHRQSTSSQSRARPDILDMDASSDEDLQEAVTHTTTLSFSDDDHPSIRPIQSTGSQQQDSRHSQRLPPMMQPIHHAGSSVSGSESQANEHMLQSPYSPQESMTAPEPIASALITATASKTDMDSRPATPCHWNVGDEKGYDLHSNKVRPPEPTPEPMPALATGSPLHLQHSDHDQPQQPQQQQHYHQEQGSPGSPRKFKTIIHRVTTLIIETETIIAPPRATKALRHDRRHDHDSDPHPGDHVMFDAGVEGDMVVSIVSSKHASLQHQHHKDEHRKQKTSQSSNKDEL